MTRSEPLAADADALGADTLGAQKQALGAAVAQVFGAEEPGVAPASTAGVGATGGPASLIYNTNAGNTDRHSPEELVAALDALGYSTTYLPTQSEDDLKRVLGEVQGTVFVAGGDGTIRAATLHLAGRAGVTLGIIPLGTANNIGRMLGIQGAALDVIAGYSQAATQPFDLGKVTAPWGEELFLEAFGCGAFAEVLAEYNPDDGKSPVRAVQALGAALGAFEPTPIVLTLDGDSHPDETPYALLEIMNTNATGPRLRLATRASTSDGVLDVVRIDSTQRDGMLAYLAALAQDQFEALPSVQTDQAKVIEIPYTGQAFHVDGEVRAPFLNGAGQGGTGMVKVEAWAGALQVLVPVSVSTAASYPEEAAGSADLSAPSPTPASP